MKKKIKNIPWKNIAILLLTILFFSFGVSITWDSAHYLGYVSIFEGTTPASEWDAVRGPIFPIFIHLSNTLFGKNNTGLLIAISIVYIIFCFFTYKLCRNLTENYKHKNAIRRTLLVISILNPLIFGYFHVLLTEFAAITMTIINVFMSYKWLNVKHNNKKSATLFTMFFIFSTVFCYHLKQPYITIIAAPLLTATIITIIHEHKLKNIIYRLGTVALSFCFLLASIFTWNAILDHVGAGQDEDRKVSSMLGEQLLNAYQIPYDKSESPIPTFDAVSRILSEFGRDPVNLTKVYLLNYCGLSSTCVISSPNGVLYTPTSNLEILNTYENSVIGYAAYRIGPNLFPLSEELYENASNYEIPSYDKGVAAPVMLALGYPTNIIYKLSILLVFPAFILIFFIRRKDKKSKHANLFNLSLILLSTSLFHMIISAGIGLIIDRYSVEIFIPSLLGIFGTFTYTKLIYRKGTKK